MERYEPKPRRVEGDSVAVCTKRSVRVVWRAGLLHPQGIRRRPSPLDQYACEAKLTTTGTASVSVDKVIPVRMPATDGSTGFTFVPGDSALPSKLELDGPSSLQLAEPILVEVRTSIGVVRPKFDQVASTVITCRN